MNRNAALAGLVVLSISLTSCERSDALHANVHSESRVNAATRVPNLSEAQRKFLTIEAVGPTQSGDVLLLPGRVAFRPQAQSAVGATVTGRVVAQLVRAGEVVKAGTPVLVIESADAGSTRAMLDQAATRLAAAESAHRRQIAMVGKGVGLELERQEAESRLKEARTEHERAQQAVALIGAGQSGRVTVRAPTNGVVISIRVAVGATVAPGGEPLLELGDPSLLQVLAQVPEGDLSRIAVGREAEIELPGLAMKVAAQVESFSPRVDPESRRTEVYLKLPKRIEGLKAGMLAQIALRADSNAAISIPVSAVVIKDGKRRVVYVEKADGTFEARDVQTGRNRDGRVVILQGLAAGEKAVVRGALLLDTQAELLL